MRARNIDAVAVIEYIQVAVACPRRLVSSTDFAMWFPMRPAQPRNSRSCVGRVVVECRAWRFLSVVSVFALTTILNACSGRAAPPPDHLQLALAPAAFAQRITLQQHVHVERDGREVDFEAVLDIGPDSLTLVGMAFGQRILTLRYDGTRLVESRSPMLPREVLGADVLSDLQLALWPVNAVRAALPTGYTLRDASGVRVLSMGDEEIATISYDGSPRWIGRVTVVNKQFAYRLVIQSAAAEP